jgi:hypothetical protein
MLPILYIFLPKINFVDRFLCCCLGRAKRAKRVPFGGDTKHSTTNGRLLTEDEHTDDSDNDDYADMNQYMRGNGELNDTEKERISKNSLLNGLDTDESESFMDPQI